MRKEKFSQLPVIASQYVGLQLCFFEILIHFQNVQQFIILAIFQKHLKRKKSAKKQLQKCADPLLYFFTLDNRLFKALSMSILQTGQQPPKRALKLTNYDSQKEDPSNMDQQNDPSKQNSRESVVEQLNEHQERLILNNQIKNTNESEFKYTQYTEKEREIKLLNKQKKIFKDTYFNKLNCKKSDNEDQSDIEELKTDQRAQRPKRKPRGNPNLKKGAGGGVRGRKPGVGRSRKVKQIKEVIVDDNSKDANQNQNLESNNQKNQKKGKWKRKRLFSLKRTGRKKQKQLDQSDYEILHIQSVELIPKRRKPGPKPQIKTIDIQSSATDNQKGFKKASNTHPVSSYFSNQNQGPLNQTKEELDDYEKFLLLYLMQKTTGLGGMLAQMLLKSSLEDINIYYRQYKPRIYELCEPFCQFYKQNPSAIKQIKLQDYQYGEHIKGLIKSYIRNEKIEDVGKQMVQEKTSQQKSGNSVCPTSNKIYLNYNSRSSYHEPLQRKANKNSESKSKENNNNVQESDIQQSVKQQQD